MRITGVDPIFVDSILLILFSFFFLFRHCYYYSFVIFISPLLFLLQLFLSLFGVYHPLFLLLAHIFYMYAYHSTSQMFFLSPRILITPFCVILHYFIGIQNIMLLFLFLQSHQQGYSPPGT